LPGAIAQHFALKSILILNNNLEYMKTVTTTTRQLDTVTGVSWK